MARRDLSENFHGVVERFEKDGTFWVFKKFHNEQESYLNIILSVSRAVRCVISGVKNITPAGYAYLEEEICGDQQVKIHFHVCKKEGFVHYVSICKRKKSIATLLIKQNMAEED